MNPPAGALSSSVWSLCFWQAPVVNVPFGAVSVSPISVQPRSQNLVAASVSILSLNKTLDPTSFFRTKGMLR